MSHEIKICTLFQSAMSIPITRNGPQVLGLVLCTTCLAFLLAPTSTLKKLVHMLLCALRAVHTASTPALYPVVPFGILAPYCVTNWVSPMRVCVCVLCAEREILDRGAHGAQSRPCQHSPMVPAASCHACGDRETEKRRPCLESGKKEGTTMSWK